MSNNIFDFYNYNFPKFNVDVNFEYYRYNPNDEELDLIDIVENFDSDIALKNNKINSYCAMKMNINILQNPKTTASKNVQSNIDKIDNNSVKTIFEGKNLNKTNTNDPNILDINFFNFRNETDDKLTSISSNIDIDFHTKLILAQGNKKDDYRNYLNESNKDSFKTYHASTKYMSDILINKKRNLFSLDKNLLENSSLSNDENNLILSGFQTKYYEIDTQLNNFIDQNITNIDDEKLIFEKLKQYNIDTYSKDNIDDSFAYFIGFLIRKNIKNANGVITKNVASEFIFYNIKSNGPLNIVKYDDLISYGNFYSYEVCPVFLLSYFKNNEIHKYLICQTSFRSNYVRAVEYFQPEPPNGLRAKYLYNINKTKLEWDVPSNPQNDVIGYFIYRREKLEEPFELIKVYSKKSLNVYKNFTLFSDTIDNSIVEVMNSDVIKQYFIDDVDNINNLYVYSICAFDAHGFVSNYSTQIGIRYSKLYNELIIDTISLANAPRTFPNLYVKRKSRLFENDNLLFNFSPMFKNKEKIKVFFTPDGHVIKNENETYTSNINIENSEYHLNIIRLTDLNSKNIRFNFK